MTSKKERSFTSVKEIIQKYFPKQTEEKAVDWPEGYGSKAEDFIERLANDFGMNLRKGLKQ
jgi:hypothetical protein